MNQKTEIYGTIGPSCMDEETLKEMIEAGMSGIRLNLSHASLAGSREILLHYRQACASAGIDGQLLIDMQGPELRIGNLRQDIDVREYISLGGDIPVSPAVLAKIEKGDHILIDDGRILLEAMEKQDERWFCKVLRPGILSSRKSFKIEGKEFNGPALTKEDRMNLSNAKSYGVNAVMQPFVRNGQDIRALRKVLHDYNCESIRIFAKIENQTGLQHLDEIMGESDMIVIARGDLGNDMPLWHLPAVQKDIEKKCLKKHKPFMVVTQMLTSMIENPVPTRAEVNDIFDAVYNGADAVMLTNETAVGKHPVEAMHYLAQTVMEAELYRENEKVS